jgi:membrane fusion protein, hemolysin D
MMWMSNILASAGIVLGSSAIGRPDRPASGDDRKPQAAAPPATTAQFVATSAPDREFLPAALELLETPPSPIVVRFIWAICLVFFAALAWSWFGRLDIQAVASGKIQPQGQSKVVQPVDLGKVVSILVKNGSQVKQGDVLVELDPTETAADSEAYAHDLESAAAEADRRRAAIETASSNMSVVAPIRFTFTTSEHVRQREQGALEADLAKLSAGQDTLKSQLNQSLATKRRLTDNIAEREALIALDKELVAMRELLITKGSGSRSQVIEASQRYETDLVTQMTDRGQLRETEEAAQGVERKLAELGAQFIAEQTEKMVDAARKRDHVMQDLVKAQSKNARTQLKAPVDGVVQQLATTTVGQVVAGGQTLMTIVPMDTPLEVDAVILNKDIGFVHEGQQAVIKIEAFPFTRYGTIEGTVLRISPDAVDMRNAPNLSEAAATVKPQAAASSSASNQPELGFPATISLPRRSIQVDEREINLTPGMAVTVEINTGSRRVIDYVLSPLREVASKTAHER